MSSIPVRKIDFGYLPSDGELLLPYVNRLKSIVMQQRYSYSTEHEKWWTHRRNSGCFICNFMDCCDYLVTILGDMAIEQEKYYWKCSRDQSGSKDPLSFVFKPYKKV